MSILFLSTDNIAHRKPADQSGTAPGTPYATADKAVDGDTNPEMSQRSCVNVVWNNFRAGRAWWQVDLKQEYDITQVTIFTTKKNRGIYLLLKFSTGIHRHNTLFCDLSIKSY